MDFSNFPPENEDTGGRRGVLVDFSNFLPENEETEGRDCRTENSVWCMDSLTDTLSDRPGHHLNGRSSIFDL